MAVTATTTRSRWICAASTETASSARSTTPGPHTETRLAGHDPEQRLSRSSTTPRPESSARTRRFHVTPRPQRQRHLGAPLRRRPPLREPAVGSSTRVFGGWQAGPTSSDGRSGAPISFLAPRGTFDPSGGALGNDHGGDVTLSQRRDPGLLQVSRQQPTAPCTTSARTVIDPATGRAVGPDNLNNSASFNGQEFFNPSAGEPRHAPAPVRSTRPSVASGGTRRSPNASRSVSRLRRRSSSGEAFFNVTNSAIFFVGDYDVNSTTFGRVTGPRDRPARRSVVGPHRVLAREGGACHAEAGRQAVWRRRACHAEAGRQAVWRRRRFGYRDFGFGFSD